VRPFGTNPDGRAVHAIDLAAGSLRATILTRGAILHEARLDGVDRNLTVGCERLSDHDGAMLYHGALVAPVANRIRNARAVIDGREHRFEANNNGHILHSASVGTHLKLWDVLEEGPDTVLLGVELPDGEGGFPGTRRVTVRFTALPPATLRMEVMAATDAATLFNAANHAYWNLDGSPTWEGHSFTVHADRYLPVSDEIIPTGVAPVEGTPYDLRAPRRLRPGEPPMDHNWCTADARGPLREVLVLQGASGVTLRLRTTEPGVQIYDGSQAARPGAVLHEALAIEAQSWPDAPSNPGFPSILLRPGETYRQVTEWAFSREEALDG
jgi:aldose 1-epimerase